MRFIHEAYWKIYKKNSLQIQRKTRSLPLSEIKKIQWRRLKNLLDYVYPNIDYYKNFFESAKLTPADINRPSDLLRLPIMKKNTYRHNFDKITNHNLSQNEYSPSSTSGSTGEPFKFLIDTTTESPNLYAAHLLNKESMGIDPFKRFNILEIKYTPRNPIINFPHNLDHKLKSRLLDIFHPNIYGLSAKHIKKENTKQIQKLFQKFKINAINGYSSSIFAIADIFSKQGISVKLKYINTIGENCLDQQKEFISKVFKCPVYRDYSSSECLHMGSECRHQNAYHMDIYNYYFEFLNGDRPAKNGEYADIVVTNLNNYVFPFIRYKIGDTALLCDLPCKCGNKLPVVKKIHGRSNDAIKTISGKEISSIHIPIEFDKFHEYMKQYQLIQVNDHLLKVKIVPTNLLNETQLDEIRNLFSNALDGTIKIDIELVNDIIPSRSGKKKVIITKEEYQGLLAN